MAFTACAKTIKQGISGMVYQQRGNMMPGPGRNTKGNPVHRTLYVFQLTNSDSLEKADSSGFWKKPPTKCLAVGFSDASGCFKAALPEGTYSLFVQEPGKGFYANRFDGNNNVFPVEVKKDSVTAVTFNISYGAAF